MEKTVLIPDHVCEKAVEETYQWQRLTRMVYWLSNGRRTSDDIAFLLSRAEREIMQAIEDLLVAQYVTIRLDKREIVLNALALKESFGLVAPQKEEFAHLFYDRLFTDYPATLPLFKDTDMPRQERSLVTTLAAVIAGVERGDNLTPVLHDLGAKHKRKHVHSQHYPLVEAVLIETFKEMLHKNFTCTMERAWTDAFEVIAGQMQEA